MLIRELESKTGLERATIRFYEREGFLKPTRQENGYRTYSEADCITLCKIKLLRQLGMSLDYIRGVQDGSITFANALSVQIENLGNQIEATSRAKEVCLEMQQAGAEYETLDVSYYTFLLNRIAPTEPAWKPRSIPEFDERRKNPRYPWRRYLARTLDYALLISIVQILVYVILRMRPDTPLTDKFLSFVVIYGCAFLMVPAAAWSLHKWGTTPGKYAFGIHLESVDGGMLTLYSTIDREIRVLCDGVGWLLPFWGLWCQFRSMRIYETEGETTWDEDVDIFYEKVPEIKRKTVAAILLVLSLLSAIWISADRALPRYRGEVTVLSMQPIITT